MQRSRQQVSNPVSSIIHDKNDHIVVVDGDNHQVFSGQGEFLSKFGEQGSLDHQLQDPYGLSIDSDGYYIVADSNNQLIKIFSPTGKFVRKIGGEGFFFSLSLCAI